MDFITLFILLTLTYYSNAHLNTVDGSIHENQLSILDGDGFGVFSEIPQNLHNPSQYKNNSFYIFYKNSATKVRLSVGPLQSETNISGTTWNDINDPSNFKVIRLEEDVNVTAHVVQTTITNNKPSIQVILHGDGPLKGQYCGRFYAFSLRGTVSDTCRLTAGLACLANLVLPYDWWSNKYVDVYFTVLPLSMCTADTDTEKLLFVDSVMLMFDDRYSSKEVTHDQLLVFSLPSKSVEPQSQFSLALKLLPRGGDVQQILLRVKTGKGLTLTSVKSADSSTWLISRDCNISHITCINITRLHQESASEKVQDVLLCEFKVSSMISILDPVISWDVAYVTHSGAQFLGYEIDTPISISHSKPVQSLVAIIKRRTVLSMTGFTGLISSYPFWIYTVDSQNKLSLVNSNCTCRSNHPEIIQVSTLCDSIYVHGFGRRAGLIDIYVALGNLSVTIPLRVWYPDPDLLVRLADDKLEQIEMWYYTDTTYGKCRPQYQTSGVKVYSRFYTRYKSKDYFLRGADNEILYSDMTPVVSHLMKVTDIDIADVSNSMIHAFSMGRTNFQILGPDGRTLASTLLRVTANAVQLLKLTTTFITDINLKLGHIKQSEILTVTSGFSSHLTNKYPIGLLEIWMHFSDKKVVPLSAFDSSTYNLEIVILSPHILEMVNDTHKGFVMIRGIGEGDGVLNITLISAGCNEVHSKDLAHTQVSIVSKVTEVAMNDDAKYRAEPKSDLNFHQSDASSGGKAKVQPLVEEMSSKSTEKKLSSLETGAIVFVGIIAFIIAGFMTHYFVATLQRHKASVQSTSQNQGKVSSGWVWLDKEILEKHSISTVPDKLIDENDMSASSRNSSKPATLRSSTYMRMHDLLSNEYTECSTPYDLSPEEFDGLRETVA